MDKDKSVDRWEKFWEELKGEPLYGHEEILFTNKYSRRNIMWGLAADINFGPGLCEKFVNFVDGQKLACGPEIEFMISSELGDMCKVCEVANLINCFISLFFDKCNKT